jgi:hypothetical protein
MDALTILLLVSVLIMLATLSVYFGVDSRPEIRDHHHNWW